MKIESPAAGHDGRRAHSGGHSLRERASIPQYIHWGEASASAVRLAGDACHFAHWAELACGCVPSHAHAHGPVCRPFAGDARHPPLLKPHLRRSQSRHYYSAQTAAHCAHSCRFYICRLYSGRRRSRSHPCAAPEAAALRQLLLLPLPKPPQEPPPRPLLGPPVAALAHGRGTRSGGIHGIQGSFGGNSVWAQWATA